ncbi:ABC transporter ATP-binding protein [Natronolimnohabitans sp. A-GB9]|uniref:ABC transporter ATP-binding protein n=1 Tax=Natronolimnohabitans sp. A-GB9 TaxID=3069757 RepID=UPI0027B03BED|nr:ABC transporter ATP-binding protein [Natronolimnohabitans sp. A-GB9]MDQ2051762.1 ABC transporter ATP-binding protein [Natronolimnohabitans sp. A-GB9]
MIELDDLTVTFDDFTAIADVDLRIEPEEFVTIVGPSGCGKTTLLRAVGGLQEPTAGRVRIDDRVPAAAQEAGDIGFVFQQHTLFPWKSALENVVFLRTMADKSPKREKAHALLRSMGLDGFEEARPSQLSGGMKQRVAIARALHLGADVLLMDEPFGELDEITRDELGAEIRSLWRQERKTIVFVTHSVPEAVFLGERCVVMRDQPGRIEATFDIDLPTPRDTDVFGSRAFQEQVAAVRQTLHESYE